MADTIQVRRDTTANWTAANPVLRAGEWAYDSTTGYVKIGDGATAWLSITAIQPGAGGGAGDVVGPASSTDNAAVRFNLTTGKLVQDSGLIIPDGLSCTISTFGASLMDDANASAGRTTLGVVIGTDVQAYDAELAAIAGLTSAADSFPYFTGSGTAALLVIGSAARTFLATPSSANLASALTDETGSGKVVFSTAPTFDSTITVGTASGTTGAVLLNGTTSGTVTFTVAAAAGTHTVKLPTADGSANQVLKTDGSGQWGWVGISQTKVRQISVVFDGQGSVLTVGTKAYLSCPFAGTITKARILADQSGSCVVDIWKDTYANYPPTIADTITASAKPTLSAAQKNEDSTLTGWTTSVSAGDTFVFNVDSATTVTRVTVVLEITTST